MELIHYGASAFDPLKFEAVSDSDWVKPWAVSRAVDPRTGRTFKRKGSAGLWASPIASSWGWKDWCVSEQFNLERLAKSFLVRITGNILTINTVEDLDFLAWKPSKSITGPSFQGIEFAKMRDSGIDAIFLTERGQNATRLSSPRNLYGWDCESVLVMNPGIIEPIGQATVAKPRVRRRAINIHRSA